MFGFPTWSRFGPPNPSINLRETPIRIAQGAATASEDIPPALEPIEEDVPSCFIDHLISMDTIDELVRLKCCKKLYDEKTLMAWVSTNPTCPNCRAQYNYSNIEKPEWHRQALAAWKRLQERTVYLANENAKLKRNLSGSITVPISLDTTSGKIVTINEELAATCVSAAQQAWKSDELSDAITFYQTALKYIDSVPVYEEYVQALECQRHPYFKEARLWLGKLQEQKGDKEKARQTFQDLLASNPDNEEAKARLTGLCT